MSVHEFFAELREWQLATFPEATLESGYRHLREEVEELGDNLTATDEIADCMLLLCFLAFRQGADPIALMRAKLLINQDRQWIKTAIGYRHINE